jgi:hypothetical protein
MLSFSLFIFFCLLVFVFGDAWKHFKIKSLLDLLLSTRKVFLEEKAWNNNAYFFCQWS